MFLSLRIVFKTMISNAILFFWTYSMFCYFNTATLMFFAKILAFLCPRFCLVIKTTFFTLVICFSRFLNFLYHLFATSTFLFFNITFTFFIFACLFAFCIFKFAPAIYTFIFLFFHHFN